jgi:hypothetical protein
MFYLEDKVNQSAWRATSQNAAPGYESALGLLLGLKLMDYRDGELPLSRLGASLRSCGSRTSQQAWRVRVPSFRRRGLGRNTSPILNPSRESSLRPRRTFKWCLSVQHRASEVVERTVAQLECGIGEIEAGLADGVADRARQVQERAAL